MDNIKARLDKMMHILADKQAQRLATEERLRQAEAQIKEASRTAGINRSNTAV
jgi:hypothetical protein